MNLEGQFVVPHLEEGPDESPVLCRPWMGDCSWGSCCHCWPLDSHFLVIDALGNLSRRWLGTPSWLFCMLFSSVLTIVRHRYYYSCLIDEETGVQRKWRNMPKITQYVSRQVCLTPVFLFFPLSHCPPASVSPRNLKLGRTVDLPWGLLPRRFFGN